jgi:uncharacterized membrane protein YkvA (DUF1232 family)
MKRPDNIEKYSYSYSEPRFFKKLKRAARWAGAKVIYAALLLYYVLRSPDVSSADKAKIYGTLGYFILPSDLIFDFIPLLGYSDDMAAIMWAIKIVASNITPDIKAQAKAKLAEWFDNYDRKQIDDIV